MVGAMEIGMQLMLQPTLLCLYFLADYHTSTYHCPVLYMHDGQNMFDPQLCWLGVDWGVDETVLELMDQGIIPPMIVVGIWNTPDRIREYMPAGRIMKTGSPIV